MIILRIIDYRDVTEDGRDGKKDCRDEQIDSPHRDGKLAYECSVFE